ncbi:hypothetical protein BH10ACI3_BH10ACI3_14520 [soil metagenome]
MNLRKVLIVLCVVCGSAASLLAQEAPPAPSAPKSATVPVVLEKKLPNGLTVAVVERRSVPLVTIQLLVKAGASGEDVTKAGLADLTAAMLTKGTTTKTATQIADAVEFLGGSIDSGAGWNSSSVTITVTSDKVEQAMAILADVVLHPKFDQKELDLLRSQALDGLTANLRQPSFLGNYVATKYSLNEHPAGGTPNSLASITAKDVAGFHSQFFKPVLARLIFAGDVSAASANALSEKLFGPWTSGTELGGLSAFAPGEGPVKPKPASIGRILVVDLPKSGQASVTYAKQMNGIGRMGVAYPTAQVLNSVLGGGYSSRLNYEIRIKRGLSYGAGSSFAWRLTKSNFATRIQTKNESAAEVAELVLAELNKLTNSSIENDELVPRKSVLTGNFGRNLETTRGLAGAIGELYAMNISTNELNSYVSGINRVSDVQIKDFASQNLLGGDVIIVGAYLIFKDDLAKRFPKIKVQVIKAADLDLSKDSLQK